MGRQVHMRVGCSLLSILFRKHLSLQPELEELVIPTYASFQKQNYKGLIEFSNLS